MAVGAEPAIAAFPEHTHDGIGLAIDAQALANRIDARRQALGHIGADDNGFCPLRHLIFGEKASLGQLQIVNDGVGGSRDHHLAVSVVVAGSAIAGSGALSACLSASRTFQARRMNRGVPGTRRRFQALYGPYSEKDGF